MNADKCIMPEMPYCPACNYGYIVRPVEGDDTSCEWYCTLPEENDKEK